MKKRYYISTAVIAYLVFFIVTIPAKSVSQIINNNSPISLAGVTGTLWNGNASGITINNVSLQDTSWDFSAWKMLAGKISIQVTTHFHDNDIKAELGTSFLGTYFLNDLSATLTADELSQLANIPLIKLTGKLFIDIEHADWSQGRLPHGTGKIIWDDATVTVAETASLGDISILISDSDKQQLIAQITNQDGDIKINGAAELIPETDYAININLSPTATASDNIKQSLGLFARKQSNGEYLFSNTGSLKNIGLL